MVQIHSPRPLHLGQAAHPGPTTYGIRVALQAGVGQIKAGPLTVQPDEVVEIQGDCSTYVKHSGLGGRSTSRRPSASPVRSVFRQSFRALSGRSMGARKSPAEESMSHFGVVCAVLETHSVTHRETPFLEERYDTVRQRAARPRSAVARRAR